MEAQIGIAYTQYQNQCTYNFQRMIADQLPCLSRSIIDKVLNSSSSQSLGAGSTSRRAKSAIEGARKKQKSCPKTLSNNFFCPILPSQCFLSRATPKD